MIEYWALSLEGVWLHYISLDGELSKFDIDAYLNGVCELSGYQHDILAQAVNELIDMLPAPPRASFSSEPDFNKGEPLAPDHDYGGGSSHPYKSVRCHRGFRTNTDRHAQ